MEIVPNLEHSLLERTGRARVADLLLGHITALGQEGKARPGA